MAHGHPLVAAPALGHAGGGVGQVSAMLWDIVRDRWPDSELLALTDSRRTLTPARKLSFGASLAWRQMLRQPAWILFTHLGPARVQRYVPRAARAPYAVFLHGIESWVTLAPADIDLLNHGALRLANSEYTARTIQRANPAVGDIIPCPLALPGSRASGRPSWLGRPPLALIVGRMAAGERYKGHDALIDVWPDVVAAVPGATLAIVGDGDDRPRLEQKARANRAADRIRFTGFLDATALDRMYGEAALFVLPSRGEGFGLVYLEAMAHGLPCIGSVHDAAGEIVVNGETGLLVDPDDASALGRAIIRLLGDRPFAERCGRAGYDRLQTHFGFARFERQVLSQLTQAFDRPCANARVARNGSVL